MHTYDTRYFHSSVTSRDDDRKRVERSWVRFAGVGVEFIVTIAALTALGIWVDGRLDTSPLFTIVLLLLGFAAATWNLIHTVLDADRPTDKRDNKP